MRSSPIIPAPNQFLSGIWQSITSFVPILGQQRSRVGKLGNNDFSYLDRNYDLEISEFPIRDPIKARQLIEMREYCPEVATAINEIADSVWSSEDGDDQGYGVAPTLNDNETKIEPEVERIVRRILEEVIPPTELEPAVEGMMGDGDAFASIGINLAKMQVSKVLFLPTWEMFRLESNDGQLWGFEQRKYLQGSDAICIHPIACVHWRYRRKKLYGRALFNESTEDWDRLKQGTDDLTAASRAIGVNPNLHIMPESCDEEYRKAYKRAYEAKKATGVVTDFYLTSGADVRKLAQQNPDLSALADNVLELRRRIAMRSRVPFYLLGLENKGAKEIAGQPALAYARFINRVRAYVTVGIRQVCNLELALSGIPQERWKYRIVWPTIYTNPYAPVLNSEANLQGIEDLDV